MSYNLGIDLGTTYTAGAIERSGTVEALTLGNRTASVPSVVFLRDDGEILVGEAATRRANSDPGRVAREFKRRVGDPTPIILGGSPYAAEMLMARVLRWAVEKVTQQEGRRPEGLALTHPANWGPYKLDLLKQAVRQVDVDVDLTLPEPVAAATFYASQRRLDPGAVVAVYDLGGGTFDAAIVRRTPSGFESVGSPEGIERLGGIDFDEAVVAHVRGAVGDALERLDPEEPAALSAMARLRQECIDAKEALSSDTDVSIPVILPNLQTEVRLTRSEFENMIRPAIDETIVALRRAIRSAKVSAAEISAVLLVGGSSRIPLVAQMVGAELGRPIAIDAHPKDAIAFGAAIAVSERRGSATPESVRTVLPAEERQAPTVAPDAKSGPGLGAVAAAGAAGAAGGAAAAAAFGAPGQGPAGPAGPGAGSTAPMSPAAHSGPQHPGAPGVPTSPSPQAPGGTGPAQGAAFGSPQGQPGGPTQGAGGYGAPAQSQGAPGGYAPPGYGQGGQAGQPGPYGRGPVGNQAGTSPYGAPAQYSAGMGGPQPQHVGTGGGTSSGGFPAAPSGQGPNRNLWIAMGVIVAAAAVIIGIIVTQSGGDSEQADDPTTTTTEGSDTTTTTDGSDTTDTTGTTSGEPLPGYNAGIEEQFVTSCSGAGSSESVCQCIYDRISHEIEFDRFYELSQEINADGTNIPPELAPIISDCALGSGSSGTGA